MDERLSQLMQQALQHPKGSHQRRLATSRIIGILQKLPQFQHRYYKSRCPDEDLFSEALSKTWLWFSNNVHKFKPRTPSIRQDLVKWLASWLRYRILDVLEKRSKETSRCCSLDVPVSVNSDGEQISRLELVSNEGKILGTPSNPYILSGLESYIESLQKQKNQQLVITLERYIEQDPDGRLRKSHPRNFPKCNSQLLISRLFPIRQESTSNLSEIAREFNIRYQTLMSHWKRRTIPLLQAIVQEIEIALEFTDPILTRI